MHSIASFVSLHGELLNLVNADVVVRETGVELVVGLVPGEGSAADVLLIGFLGLTLGLGIVELVGLEGGLFDSEDVLLGGEVENLDSIFASNDDPVEFLGEDDTVHGGIVLVTGEVLAFNQVPDHDLTVMRSGSEVGEVVDHVDGVDLGLVSDEGVHELHVGVVPNLDGLIPRGGDAQSGLVGVVEPNAGDGVGVAVLVNGVLALGLDVPDLDLVVATSGKDLSVISGQGDGEDVLGVSNELVDGLAGGDVPEADGAVPRGREAEATISSEADLVNEVRVSGEHLLGSSPLNIILISVSFVKLPLDKGLVARAGEEEFNFLSINLLLTNSEGGNPATVA